MKKHSLAITLSIIFIASAYAVSTKPWKEVKKKPSEKELAMEILRLETSGYRVPGGDASKCLEQTNFKYIKAKAPMTFTEGEEIKPIVLDKLPEIVDIASDESDPSLRILTFMVSGGKTDKLSFSINHESLFEEAGFSGLVDSPEKAYVRKECQ